jgi:hypothetical protein
MRKLIGVLLLCPMLVYGAVIATMPNQAGGKIVLTDEPCVYGNKSYPSLLKAYFYTPEGITGNGCWRLDDETIIIAWIDSNTTRRYPAENFDIRKRGKNL